MCIYTDNMLLALQSVLMTIPSLQKTHMIEIMGSCSEAGIVAYYFFSFLYKLKLKILIVVAKHLIHSYFYSCCFWPIFPYPKSRTTLIASQNAPQWSCGFGSRWLQQVTQGTASTLLVVFFYQSLFQLPPPPNLTSAHKQSSYTEEQTLIVPCSKATSSHSSVEMPVWR